MQLFIYSPQPYKTVFAICLYTGCRVSEALALKRKYITDEIIIFPKGITKGQTATRTVNITRELKLFLNTYKPPRDSVYMFTGKRGVSDTINRTTAHKALNQVCSKLGIIGVSTHSFRRTALTKMHNGCVPLSHIQAISGHASLNELQKYLGVTPEDKQNAVLQLSFLG